MAKRKLCNFADSNTRTRNLLQDLISSKVVIKRLKLSSYICQNYNHESLPYSSPIILNGDKNKGLCSICYEDKEGINPTTNNQMNILNELVLKSWGAENDVTSELEFRSICILCSETLERLGKLNREVGKIILCLRSVIRMRRNMGENSYVVAAPSTREPSSFSTKSIVTCLPTVVEQGSVTDCVELVGLNGSNTIVQEEINITPPAVMEFEITDVDTDDEDVIEEGNSVDNEETAVVSPNVVVMNCTDENPCTFMPSDDENVIKRHGTATKSILQKLKICRKRRTNHGRNVYDSKKPTCHECGKMFTLKTHLIRHQKNKLIHQRKCDICEHEYCRVKQFRAHLSYIRHAKGMESIRIGQTGEVTFACSMCGRHFSFLKVLLEHEKRTHQSAKNEMSLRCKPCDKGFKLISDYKEHVISKAHANAIKTDSSTRRAEGRLFHCKNCNKRFVTMETLSDHKDECKFFINVDVNDEDLKPLILNMEFDIVDDEDDVDAYSEPSVGLVANGDSDKDIVNVTERREEPEVGRVNGDKESQICNAKQIDNSEIRIKRQSRKRAEEKLDALAKIENATDTMDEGDSDADYQDDSCTEDVGDEEDSDDDFEGDSCIEAVCKESNSRLKQEVIKCQTRKGEVNSAAGLGDEGLSETNFGGIVHQDNMGEQKKRHCDPCGTTFTTFQSYREHLLTAKHANVIAGKVAVIRQKSCDPCGTTFTTFQRYREHLLTAKHANVIAGNVAVMEPRQKSCDPCGTTFTTFQSYREHLLTAKHANVIAGNVAVMEPQQKSCDPCGTTFTTSQTYREHLLTVKHANVIGGKDAVMELQQKRKNKCEYCDRRFVTKKRLRSHQKIHDSNRPRPNVCETCGKQFTQLNVLKKHQQIHGDRPKMAHKKANRFIALQDKAFPCVKCEKRFSDVGGLRRHVKAIHKGIRIKCDICPRDFANNSGLLHHKRTIHEHKKAKRQPCEKERFECEMCTKTLVAKWNLVRHIELKHFPEQDSCPYGCPDKFESKQEWISHLEQCKSEKITEKSKCYCHDCRAVFSNQLLRISHHLDLHPTFPCEFCLKVFTRKDILTLHLYSHEESKPYLCSKCGQRFKQQYNLQLHSTTVCGDDEDAKKELIIKRREKHRIFREKEKPYKCDICSKGFVEERRLAAHKLKKHQDEDEIEGDM